MLSLGNQRLSMGSIISFTNAMRKAIKTFGGNNALSNTRADLEESKGAGDKLARVSLV